MEYKIKYEFKDSATTIDKMLVPTVASDHLDLARAILKTDWTTVESISIEPKEN